MANKIDNDSIESSIVHDGFDSIFTFKEHRLPIKGYNLIDVDEGLYNKKLSSEYNIRQHYISYDSNTILLWENNINTNKPIVLYSIKIKDSQCNITSIILVANMKIFLASSLDMSFKIYDKKLNLLESIRHEERAILHLEYDSNNDYVISSGASGVIIWRIYRNSNIDGAHIIEKLYTFNTNNNVVWVNKLLYESHCDRLYAIYDKTVHVLSINKKSIIAELNNLHDAPVTTMCWYSRTQFYLSGCSNGEIKCWTSHHVTNKNNNNNIDGYALLHTFNCHTRSITAIKLHPVSGLAISCSLDGYFKVLNLEALTELFSINANNSIIDMKVVSLGHNNYGCLFVTGINIIKMWKITSVAEYFSVSNSVINNIISYDNIENELILLYKQQQHDQSEELLKAADTGGDGGGGMLAAYIQAHAKHKHNIHKHPNPDIPVIDNNEIKDNNENMKKLEKFVNVFNSNHINVDGMTAEEHERETFHDSNAVINRNVALLENDSGSDDDSYCSSINNSSNEKVISEHSNNNKNSNNNNSSSAVLSDDSDSSSGDETYNSNNNHNKINYKSRIKTIQNNITTVNKNNKSWNRVDKTEPRLLVSTSRQDIRVYSSKGIVLGRLEPEYIVEGIKAISVSVYQKLLFCLCEKDIIRVHCANQFSMPLLKEMSIWGNLSNNNDDEINSDMSTTSLLINILPDNISKASNTSKQRKKRSINGNKVPNYLELFLLVGMNNGSLIFYDTLNNLETYMNIQAHTGHIVSMKYRKESKQLLVLGKDISEVNFSVRVWGFPSVEMLYEISHMQNITAFDTSLSFAMIAVGNSRGRVSLYHTRNIDDGGSSNNAKVIESGDYITEEIFQSEETHRAKINSICFCDELRVFFSCCARGEMKVWNFEKQLVRTVRLNLECPAMVPNGNAGDVTIIQGQYLLTVLRSTWDEGNALEKVKAQTNPWIDKELTQNETVVTAADAFREAGEEARAKRVPTAMEIDILEALKHSVEKSNIAQHTKSVIQVNPKTAIETAAVAADTISSSNDPKGNISSQNDRTLIPKPPDSSRNSFPAKRGTIFGEISATGDGGERSIMNIIPSLRKRSSRSNLRSAGSEKSNISRNSKVSRDSLCEEDKRQKEIFMTQRSNDPYLPKLNPEEFIIVRKEGKSGCFNNTPFFPSQQVGIGSLDVRNPRFLLHRKPQALSDNVTVLEKFIIDATTPRIPSNQSNKSRRSSSGESNQDKVTTDADESALQQHVSFNEATKEFNKPLNPPSTGKMVIGLSPRARMTLLAPKAFCRNNVNSNEENTTASSISFAEVQREQEKMMISTLSMQISSSSYMQRISNEKKLRENEFRSVIQQSARRTTIGQHHNAKTPENVNNDEEIDNDGADVMVSINNNTNTKDIVSRPDSHEEKEDNNDNSRNESNPKFIATAETITAFLKTLGNIKKK